MDTSTILLFAQETSFQGLGAWISFSVLHFLEFAIWGAWYVVLGNYLNSLKFSRKDIGNIYSTIWIGSIAAPMFVGVIADRYVNTEWVLAVSHLLGALFLYAMAQIQRSRPFFWVALLYALVYAPTLALVNSIVFAHLELDDFFWIRVWGSIGWILVGLSLKLFLKPGQSVNNRPLLLAATLSAILGVFCFFLPTTPPPGKMEARGGKATFSVVLSTQPKSDVTVELSSSDTTEGVVAPSSLIFKSDTWDTPQAVVITGREDDEADGDVNYTIVTAPATTTDPNYSGRDAADVNVTNKETGSPSKTMVPTPPADTTRSSPEIIVYPTSGLVTTEKGGLPLLDALELFRDPSFAAFFSVSFLISLALSVYFSFTALFLEQDSKISPDNIGPVMIIGQVFEVAVMLTLPWFLGLIGMKWVLAVGALAWGLRYGLFAIGRPLALVILGIALHGICYNFFFTAGATYVEQAAPKVISASAQSLFVIVTYGLGMTIGAFASGWLNEMWTREVTDPHTNEVVRVTDWRRFWLVPCGVVLVSFVLLVIFVRA